MTWGNLSRKSHEVLLCNKNKSQPLLSCRKKESGKSNEQAGVFSEENRTREEIE
jgi:hypothetical protein